MLEEGAGIVALLCFGEGTDKRREEAGESVGMENEERGKFKEPLPHHRGQSSLPECSPWRDRGFVKGFFSSECKEWRKTGTGSRTKLGDVKE